MKTRILQISDLHVGKSNSESGNLRRIVEKVIDRFKNQNLVILMTGDIVDDGQKKQYKQATKILKPLFENPNFAIWPVPGNHDYGWNGIHAERKRFKYFKSAFWGFENVSYPHVKTDLAGNIFIGLNSMQAESDFWDGLLADGELGSKQIHNVSGILSTFEGLPAGRPSGISCLFPRFARARKRANSTSPDLSETETRARETGISAIVVVVSRKTNAIK